MLNVSCPPPPAPCLDGLLGFRGQCFSPNTHFRKWRRRHPDFSDGICQNVYECEFSSKRVPELFFFGILGVSLTPCQDQHHQTFRALTSVTCFTYLLRTFSKFSLKLSSQWIPFWHCLLFFCENEFLNLCFFYGTVLHTKKLMRFAWLYILVKMSKSNSCSSRNPQHGLTKVILSFDHQNTWHCGQPKLTPFRK